MTVAESGDLRRKMREAGAGFKVTRIGLPSWRSKARASKILTACLQDQRRLVCRKTLWPLPRRSLITPRKSKNACRWQYGRETLDQAGVEALAKMPSLAELRGKLVGLVQAPAAKVARVTQLRPANSPRHSNTWTNCSKGALFKFKPLME